MKKLLFICSENRLRSATAEAVFSEYEGVEAIGAGTNHDAATPVSGDLIEWADVILVMEEIHRDKVSAKYRKLLKGKQLAVLDIPDNYRRMQPELIHLLETKVSKYIS
ncbi:MAG: phosphotyrosine protein phosphatase [Nitrospinota bacterium]|nr:phosphotyrosine protein phosphatase [Nitrospinota bacterium]